MKDEKKFNIVYCVSVVLLMICFLLLGMAIYTGEIFWIFFVLVPGLSALTLMTVGLIPLSERIESK